MKRKQNNEKPSKTKESWVEGKGEWEEKNAKKEKSLMFALKRSTKVNAKNKVKSKSNEGEKEKEF